MKFTGQHYKLNFSLPNFYFHATTAYNVRAKWALRSARWTSWANRRGMLAERNRRSVSGSPINCATRIKALQASFCMASLSPTGLTSFPLSETIHSQS